MIGTEYVTKLNAISLSNDSVHRRIADMSADIIDQIFQEIKAAPLPIFSIQLDKSTDVANCSQLLVYVSDESKLQKIAYLVDIFAILNELNLSLQGPNTTCLDLSEKIQSFQMKLQLWQTKLNETLSAFYEKNSIEPDKRNTMIISVKEHLHMLADEISSYFPNLLNIPFALARNPFTVKVEDVPETSQEEFIELISSDAAKNDLSLMSVTQLWIKCLQPYPVLSEIVLRLFLPFSTTYLCKTGFSSQLVIKSKYRNRLNAEDDLRCALAKTAQIISDLVKHKQAKPSH
ncbi:zinc finger BED domain-containing protein 5-like [Hydra vulgaris]|uniref:Zinc finger BED domain-containing protein 5-like n=1 Tax=Hydra vulgaris TaxID=6087 RepID=A0ABM4D1F3_HYDVU